MRTMNLLTRTEKMKEDALITQKILREEAE